MSRLLVVWELDTDDYGFFGSFYPAVRIAGACENRGIELRFLFARDVPSFLGAVAERDENDAVSESLRRHPPDKPLAPSIEAFRPDSCLIRGMTDIQIIHALEKAGIRCVNSSRATAIANDKLATFSLAVSLGIATPKTALAGVHAPALAAGLPAGFRPSFADASRKNPAYRLPEGLKYPVVVKPRFGSRGRGVSLARNAEEARAFSASAAPAVLQEYVACSHGRDLRVFFTRDGILAVAERINGEGGLVSNAARGGTMRPSRLPAPEEAWREKVLALARGAGLAYGSADFLFTEDGGLSLCEVNAAPGFEELERACGVDAAGAVVDAATGAGR